ncbi:MAG: lipocalin family protein [Aquaticitalea sp.]
MQLKLFNISLVLITLISFFSCDKDDDSNNEDKTVNELILGKWQQETIYDLQGNDVTDECTQQNIMEFFPDNTMEWFSYSEHAGNCAEYFYHLYNNVTYTIINDSLVIHFENLDGGAENELTYTNFEVSETLMIIRLTVDHEGAIYRRLE